MFSFRQGLRREGLIFVFSKQKGICTDKYLPIKVTLRAFEVCDFEC